jgi:hypothetical protein
MSREILSRRTKDGKFLQRIYSGTYRKAVLPLDELAKATARKAVLPPDVFLQAIEDPSVKIVEPEPRMVNVMQGEVWRAQIMAYLCHHYEPNNNTEWTRMQ